MRGQSQKKDGSPSLKLKTEINFVKSVFFCRSLCFCPYCSKCPQCCKCSAGRRASAKFLAEVVPPGCKSESSVHLEGRLHSLVQKQTSSGKGSIDSQWLYKPPQEPLPERGQRGQVNGSIPGYKDPPVPRRLVDSSPYQRILPPGHPIPPVPLSGIGLGGEPTKIRVGTQAGIRICGLPIRPLTRTGQTDPEPL